MARTLKEERTERGGARIYKVELAIGGLLRGPAKNTILPRLTGSLLELIYCKRLGSHCRSGRVAFNVEGTNPRLGGGDGTLKYNFNVVDTALVSQRLVTS